jgi:hypothetical protein
MIRQSLSDLEIMRYFNILERPEANQIPLLLIAL